eukprot:3010221-Amphidinium_carterae.1
MSSTRTTVSPLALTVDSNFSDRRSAGGKRRTTYYSSGYEDQGSSVPEEELLQATTPRTPAKLRRTCSNGYQDPQFDALSDSV